jgi:hypothetical protein
LPALSATPDRCSRLPDSPTTDSNHRPGSQSTAPGSNRVVDEIPFTLTAPQSAGISGFSFIARLDGAEIPTTDRESTRDSFARHRASEVRRNKRRTRTRNTIRVHLLFGSAT